MLVSLKRASELARLAFETANKINVETTSKVSVFANGDIRDNVMDASIAGEKNFNESLKTIESLISAGYEIRNSLAVANMKSDASGQTINDYLNRIAFIEAMEKQFNKVLSEYNEGESYDEAVAQLMQAKKVIDRGEAYYDRHVVLNVVGKTVQDNLRKRLSLLRREKSDLRDTKDARNINEKIKLSDEVVDVLTKNDIIVK